MTGPRTDDVDARVDRVLRAYTAPRPDPGFLTRVQARIEDARRPGWLPPLVRLALPAAVVCFVAALWWLAPRVDRDPADLPREAGTSSSGAVPAGPPPPVHQATTNAGPADATAGGAGGTVRLASTDTGRGSGPRIAVALRPRSPQRADTTSAREPDNGTAPVIPPVVVARLEIDAIGVEPLATTQPFWALPPPERLEVTPIEVERLGPER